MGRFDIYHEIQKLDPERDCQRIVYLVGAYEFPFTIQRSLEFALFRTFAVPSIAQLLVETGEFSSHGQKRYDDTALLVAEFSEYGYESERGLAAIRRMNQMHRRFNISNDDYLYVLSTFILEPIRWNRHLAWRPATEKENQANYYFWREIGRRMGIKDIPPSLEAFDRFNREYERQHFKNNPYSEAVARDTVRVFTSWFPAFLRPAVRVGIYALLDDPLRETFGFPKAPRWLTWLLFRLMRVRAGLMRILPARRTAFSLTRHRMRSYPTGYTIDQLGTQKNK
jgi:hypothetical protein